jgi:VIT1/CCC1 family predicted Fe2+/Mn2+ transporter
MPGRGIFEVDARASWFEEKQSAFLYRQLADVETHPPYKVLFRSLASAAEIQAAIWAQRLSETTGQAVPRFRPARRARAVAWLLRRLGPRRLRPILAGMKVRGISVYRGGAPTGHAMPTSVEEVGHRHKSVGSGGNVRAAVFGINDGLVSNASLVMGIAGATADAHMVYLSGVAGMLAGAFSMAAGEYISMRSQRELYEYQIGLERDELSQYPEEEAEELALIYQARGVPIEQARQTANELIKDPTHALDTLAREELGLNPDDLGSPWGAALASFGAFALGAIIPILPFVFNVGGIGLTVIITLVSLFVVGVSLSLFTGRGAWQSGARMMLIGASAGAVTFALGKLLGVSLS